ncbi:MAG: hypothetical protein LH660_18215 [Phormidesmis sp. CAN_BIN36]|nr:hypothetical protein [Phormidesmis sp. CAN_BIN36]
MGISVYKPPARIRTALFTKWGEARQPFSLGRRKPESLVPSPWGEGEGGVFM